MALTYSDFEKILSNKFVQSREGKQKVSQFA